MAGVVGYRPMVVFASFLGVMLPASLRFRDAYRSSERVNPNIGPGKFGRSGQSDIEGDERGGGRSGQTLDSRVGVESAVEAHQLRDVVVGHDGDV
jgi:hypothetical protein